MQITIFTYYRHQRYCSICWWNNFLINLIIILRAYFTISCWSWFIRKQLFSFFDYVLLWRLYRSPPSLYWNNVWQLNRHTGDHLTCWSGRIIALTQFVLLLQTSVCALDFFVVVVGVCFFSHTLFPPSYMDISLNTLSVEVRGQIWARTVG